MLSLSIMGLFWQLLCTYFDESMVYTFYDVHAVQKPIRFKVPDVQILRRISVQAHLFPPTKRAFQSSVTFTLGGLLEILLGIKPALYNTRRMV